MPIIRIKAEASDNKRALILLFIMGLGSNLFLHFGSYIAIADILAGLLGPFAILRVFKLKHGNDAKLALIFSALWLLGAIGADIINVSPVALAIKGFFKVSLIALQLAIGYDLLHRNPSGVRWYFLGATLSAWLSAYILKPGSIALFEQVNGITLTDSFEKQWIAVVLFGTITAWFFLWQRFPTASAVAVLIGGCLTVFGGSRSTGGIMMAAGCAVFFVRASAIFDSYRVESEITRIFLLGTSLVLVGMMVAFSYGFAAKSGWLGDRATDKYTSQVNSRFGLLLGGRSDFVAGLLAIEDKPFIGHGTWAADTEGYRFRASQLVGVDYFEFYADEIGRIGGHSSILEAWVEHGILSLPFWMFMLFIIGKCSYLALRRNLPAIGPVLILLFGRIWDTFFSPIGGLTTLAVTYALFIIIVEGAYHSQPSRLARHHRRQKVPSYGIS